MVIEADKSANVAVQRYGRNNLVHWASTPLCIEFTYTLEDRWSNQGKELFNSFADLVGWCRDADLLSEIEAGRMLLEGNGNQVGAVEALNRAKAWRESIYSVFLAIAQSAQPEDRALDELNEAIASTSAKSRIIPVENGFEWTCVRDCDAPERILWPVIRSAGALLTSEDRNKLKCCASSDCLFLFFDTSRNGMRRWCDMKTCGNRAKVRRHYQKKKMEV